MVATIYARKSTEYGRRMLHLVGEVLRQRPADYRVNEKRSANRLEFNLARTAVRNLERAGVPRSVAMKIVEHKTEAVYRRYAIASESDLHDAARKLAALPAGTFSGTSAAVVE
jgi:hypothetical protein